MKSGAMGKKEGKMRIRAFPVSKVIAFETTTFNFIWYRYH